ncbi:MAG: polysaccharide biosynthesis C-terminal domain-containing protein [Bacteroidetes bacterium]|nr:polysaccharide biosynthesis C-terminal domain-containing protein [Bacteroidota bacterium]
MSNPLKKLAGQTVIYGLGTILPRFLNYLLTPILTYVFQKPVDYGINSEFYAYIAFLNIVFTYGMETAFFNFTAKRENKTEVFNTALSSLLISTFSLGFLFFMFSSLIADWLEYENKKIYIYWAIGILMSDAFMAIPFANLRINNKAKTFALIKAFNIFVNICLHIFFFIFCKNAYENPESNSTLASFYNPEIGIGYSFLSNLLANLFSILLLLPQYFKYQFSLNKVLWKEMIVYSLPLLILGLAGMINETFDRIIIKKLLPEEVGKYAQGIYGACYKLSMFMTIFRQAFSYAAEPFFFNNAKNKDSKYTYAFIMKAFVIFCSFIFLATCMNLPILKYIINKNYWEGLRVVPILLLANLFLGVSINLSIWYKLTGQTKFGAYITIIGAIITLIINFAFVPIFSYMASAWATLAAYAIMMLLNYYIGKRYYPVPYNVKAMLFFFILSLALYLLSFLWQNISFPLLKLILNNLLLAVFVYLFYKLEFNNLKKFKQNANA